MLLNRPTRNWLESNSPSLHQTQDGSDLHLVVVGTHPESNLGHHIDQWMVIAP